MTHKIKASSGQLFLAIILSIIMSFPIGWLIYSIVCVADDGLEVFLFAFLILMSLPFPILAFILANRLGCTVEYNEEANKVSRKGLFYKFEYSVSVDNIRDVIIVFHGRAGYWIELIDNVQCNYDTFRKNSYIGFELNHKNIEFVKLFWDKPITQEMVNGKLKELSDYDKRLYGLK